MLLLLLLLLLLLKISTFFHLQRGGAMPSLNMPLFIIRRTPANYGPKTRQFLYQNFGF